MASSGILREVGALGSDMLNETADSIAALVHSSIAALEACTGVTREEAGCSNVRRHLEPFDAMAAFEAELAPAA